MAAMMAAGISRWRIAKPLVFCVALIAILGMLNRELVIPRLGSSIMRAAKNYAGDQSEEVRSQYDHATEIFVDGKGVIPAERAIESPHFGLPDDLAPRGTRIVAERAIHKDATAERPRGFLVTGVESGELSVRTSLVKDGSPVVIHPHDAAWLEPDQLYVATELPFEQLRASANWRQYASTLNLISGARNKSLDSGADVSVRIHARILQPVMDMIVLFLGLPIVLSRESRNAFIAVGSCMSVVAVFVVATLGFHSMGNNYMIGPTLAVWLPMMIFVPVATLISEPLRR